jgi:hypothetical protein
MRYFDLQIIRDLLQVKTPQGPHPPLFANLFRFQIIGARLAYTLYCISSFLAYALYNGIQRARGLLAAIAIVRIGLRPESRGSGLA